MRPIVGNHRRITPSPHFFNGKDPADIKEYLNQLGDQGWEIIYLDSVNWNADWSSLASLSANQCVDVVARTSTESKQESKMKPPDKPDFWFYAKRYGWGWGLPARWEGWVVLLGYGALIIGGIFLLMEQSRQLYFFGYIGILTLLLLAICWWKGEAPRWRWGGGAKETAPPDLNTRGLLVLHLFFGPLLLGLASYFHSSPP